MTDRAHAPLIAVAVVLWTLALLLTSASWRLAPAEWPYANLPHPTTTTARSPNRDRHRADDRPVRPLPR